MQSPFIKMLQLLTIMTPSDDAGRRNSIALECKGVLFAISSKEKSEVKSTEEAEKSTSAPNRREERAMYKSNAEVKIKEPC